MEIELQPTRTSNLTKVRLPVGLVAALIITADYAGWGYPFLTALAVTLIMGFQVLLSTVYMYMMWRTTKHRVPALYGWALMRRYFYVCGFALLYAVTEHWWLVTFQGVVIVTLTAFVVEHKNK